MRNALLPRVLLRIAIATWLSLIAAVLFISQAKADVVTCESGPSPNNADCAVLGSKPKATLSGTATVLWCGSNYPNKGATTGCDNPLWMKYAQMQASNWVMFDAGWFRLNEAPPDGQAPPPNPPPTVSYKCKPAYWEDVWKDIDVANQRAIGWWYCDTGEKIVLQWYCGNPEKLPHLRGRIGMAQILKLAAFRRNCSQAEVTAMNESILVGERLKAATYGTTADIPMYSIKPDGTLGAASRKRISVGADCNYYFRVVTITNGVRKGTNYLAVVGEDNLYANCKFDGPLIAVK